MSERADGMRDMVRCFGCAGLVPDIDGPTHAYLAASPGCWQRYGELIVMDHAGSDLSLVPAHVDCYAAQHPGGARHDRRQRQSVAIHLVALYLMLEHGLPGSAALTARSRLNRVVLPHAGMADWPYLEPPNSPATITVVDVYAAATRGEYPAYVTRWADAVWTAWSDHHPVIRRWGDVMLAAL